MKCEFTETQFSFLFTFEILRRYPERLKMPWFPNTIQEGREGGGFDVRIDIENNFTITGSLFFQFKIPTYLKKDKKYKIVVDTKGRQFHLLKKLRDKGPANLIYYAAPKFHTCERLESFYTNNTVEMNSALFYISDFPTDSAYHQLKYEYYDIDNKQSYGILHSDPLYIEISKDIFSNNYTPFQMSLSEKARYILSLIQEIDSSIRYDNTAHIINYVFSILLVRYNILWVPII